MVEVAGTHKGYATMIPQKAAWFLFTSRARFHDRPGFPALRRWHPVDMRILERARSALDAAVVTFYQSVSESDPFDSSAKPYTYFSVEIRAPDKNLGDDKFLPSWFGRYQEGRELQYRKASILYINRFPG